MPAALAAPARGAVRCAAAPYAVLPTRSAPPAVCARRTHAAPSPPLHSSPCIRPRGAVPLGGCAGRNAGRPHRCALRPRAALPEGVDATIRNVVVIGSLLGSSYAVLLAAATQPPPPPPASGRSLPGAAPGAGPAPGGEDNFVWGLMGFVSVLPLFGWLAWVLAAMTDERRAPLYGTYAALYAVPLLTRGLDWQDPWVLGVLGLGALHVQLERIAQTEPETLRAVRPLRLAGGLLRGVVGGTGSVLTGIGGTLKQDAQRARHAPDGSSPPAQLPEGKQHLTPWADSADRERGEGQQGQLTPWARGQPGEEQGQGEGEGEGAPRDPRFEDYAKRELRDFDRQLQQRQQQRRGGGGGKGRGGPPVL